MARSVPAERREHVSHCSHRTSRTEHREERHHINRKAGAPEAAPAIKGGKTPTDREVTVRVFTGQPFCTVSPAPRDVQSRQEVTWICLTDREHPRESSVLQSSKSAWGCR